MRTLDSAPDQRKVPFRLMRVVSLKQNCSPSTTHHPAARDRSTPPTLVNGRSVICAQNADIPRPHSKGGGSWHMCTDKNRFSSSAHGLLICRASREAPGIPVAEDERYRRYGRLIPRQGGHGKTPVCGLLEGGNRKGIGAQSSPSRAPASYHLNACFPTQPRGSHGANNGRSRSVARRIRGPCAEEPSDQSALVSIE